MLDDKQCPDCGETKPRYEFGQNRGRPDGLAFYCKSCFQRRAREHYANKRAAAGHEVQRRYDGPSDHKRCSGCREVKPLTEFHRRARQAGGRSPYCKGCTKARQRATHLKRMYGMTAEDYDRLLERQGGLCALCRERPAEHVDHDHRFGNVRGLLCSCCNQGLGNFRDDRSHLAAAVDYLERTTWSTEQVSTGVYQLTSPRPGAAASPSS